MNKLANQVDMSFYEVTEIIYFIHEYEMLNLNL